MREPYSSPFQDKGGGVYERYWILQAFLTDTADYYLVSKVKSISLRISRMQKKLF